MPTRVGHREGARREEKCARVEIVARPISYEGRIYARINHDGSRELLFVSPAAERSPAPLSHAYTVRVSNPPVPSFVAFVVPFSHPPREQASRQGGAGAILFPFPAPSCPAGVLILEFEELSLPVENV